MRTSLLVSTLLAVSAFGSIALAESPRGSFDRARKHGEMHERFQRPDRVSHAGSTATPRAASSSFKSPGASRMNCSEASGDCTSSRAAARTTQAQSGRLGDRQALIARKGPNVLEGKVSDRMSCNEGDQCSLSTIGAKAIWSKARASNGASDAASSRPGASSFGSRDLHKAHEARMGGDGEPYMSSKAAKKIWRIEAFKAGTVAPSDKGDVGDPSAAAKKNMTDKKYDR
jgi:hypothetical protein